MVAAAVIIGDLYITAMYPSMIPTSWVPTYQQACHISCWAPTRWYFIVMALVSQVLTTLNQTTMRSEWSCKTKTFLQSSLSNLVNGKTEAPKWIAEKPILWIFHFILWYKIWRIQICHFGILESKMWYRLVQSQPALIMMLRVSNNVE